MSHQQELLVDPDILRRFDVKGPRYTSYPTADRFNDGFGAEQLTRWLGQQAAAVDRPLSLYLHIPFCSSICYYCACNKIVTRDRTKSAKYISYLDKELELCAAHFPVGKKVVQLHLGGGTPTFLADEELAELMRMLRRRFDLLDGGEYSIEVDPRKLEAARVAHLAQLGFNRMSIGVQDFDAEVQKAVHREQSLEETANVMSAARAAGFSSIGLDLIYGLPRQTPDSFERSLALLLDLQPDRVALFNYAHLPHLAKPQRRIKAEELPPTEAKLQMLQQAVARMTAAGYVFIGMDHFAKPTDELALVQQQGRLQRNFQGYSTHGEADLLGLGVSAISQIGACYSQNQRDLAAYYAALDRGQLPVMRGFELNADDMLRRSVIQSLMCHFALSIEAVEAVHAIDFAKAFAVELRELRALEEAGLVRLDAESITVLPRGRLLVRAIAMVFDRYLRAGREAAHYSRVI